MYLSGYAPTLACLLSSRRVEEVTEEERKHPEENYRSNHTTLRVVRSLWTTRAEPDRVAAIHVEVANADTKRRRDQSDEVVFESLRCERRSRAVIDRRTIGEVTEVRHGCEEEKGRGEQADRSTTEIGEVLCRTPARENAGVHENRQGLAGNKHAATVAASRSSERVAVRRLDGCLARCKHTPATKDRDQLES